MNTASIYEVEFITSGAVGYPEDNESYYIRDSALEKMSSTMIGRPVLMGHDGNTPIGHVTDVRKKDNGYYSAILSIFDREANKYLDDGYGFSSAYIVTEYNENTEINGVKYSLEVLDGVYDHIAVVKHPRYNELSFLKKNAIGGKMNFFRSNSIKKKNIDSRLEELETRSISDKSFVLLGGSKVMLNEILSLYKEAKENEANMISFEDIVDIEGEGIKVSDLIEFYKENEIKEDTTSIKEIYEESLKETRLEEDAKSNNSDLKSSSFSVIKNAIKNLGIVKNSSYKHLTFNERENIGKINY